jgi:asparagine N-glycosylation enzyme membrane subunit Stt3
MVESQSDAHRRTSDISPRVARRLRVSGAFLLAGMAVEAVSLLWSHPTSFLIFAGIGGLFLLVGLGAYLFSLVFTK